MNNNSLRSPKHRFLAQINFDVPLEGIGSVITVTDNYLGNFKHLIVQFAQGRPAHVTIRENKAVYPSFDWIVVNEYNLNNKDMITNRGILTDEDIKALTKFWNKKSFRTFTKTELEKRSKRMQLLVLALKGLTLSEIAEIRKKNRYAKLSVMEHRIRIASQSDLDYAISISPKSYNLK